MADIEVYTGIWTDWSRGGLIGATWTLSTRDASFLLAFLAVFVTIISARLWHVVAFTAHQVLAGGGTHDGLYYQRQHILRNSQTPVAAVWLFLQQAYTWYGTARRSLVRTLPWALGGFLYAAAMAILAIFSSTVSDQATETRLVKGGDCTISGNLFGNATTIEEKVPYFEAGGLQTLQASTYARQCYGELTSPLCKELPVPHIRWNNESTSCPFDENVCLGETALLLDSGLVDSHDDLGINDIPRNRLQYRREVICAPLKQIAEFMMVDPSDSNWIQYLYGPSQDMDHTFSYNINSANYTYIYTTDHRAYAANVTANHFWTPVDQIFVPDRDISLLFIAFNSLNNTHRSDDPVFAATNSNGDGLWQFDNYVGIIGCTEGHQFCNPSNGMCSPLRGIQQALNLYTKDSQLELELNSFQTAIMQRMKLDSVECNFEMMLETRRSSWLRAQEFVVSMDRSAYAKLELNQWEIEVRSLFLDGLAKLQWRTLGHTMSDGWGAFTKGKFWEDAEKGPIYTEDPDIRSVYNGLCHKQRTMVTQGTLHFSLLGLAIFCVVGALIIGLSYVVEPGVRWVQMKTRTGMVKAHKWSLDDSLQVMRMYLEMKNAETWIDESALPRTVHEEYFEVVSVGEYTSVSQALEQGGRG